ncbi:MAG: HAD-IA family hydrolase [Oscillospiraceae bacterium]|jgi:HAD superfamily hydrolase (TIGR01509 family)|nr:HAD-IA family hydrolase [Oscillospiraceae bacterium]
MPAFDNAVIYHIYPLGYCGCPPQNSYTQSGSPILRVIEQLPILKAQGFNTIFFGPLFESSRHGYDTADYRKLDSRLGTNDDFKKVCAEIHALGMRVIVDGVFNHVGREFWAFKDLLQHKLSSRYKDWFHVRDGNSNYNDGFWYEGWEGHFELVKLNLYNPEVKEHIFDSVKLWRDEFGLDGLRLDVAYCLEPNFLKELHTRCKSLSPDFWIMGEAIHGNYATWANNEMCDSVTNYVCYKGLYSSFNSLNMFEIAHSLNQQYSSNNWGNVRGRFLYCFADNHDVSRVASILTNKEHLAPLYTLLFTMPGVPGVYYGSEYAVTGEKSKGDSDLRREFKLSEAKAIPLTSHIAKLAKAHTKLKPLCVGDYRHIILQNKFFAFERELNGDKVFVLINADSGPSTFNLWGDGEYVDVLSGDIVNTSAPITLPAYQSAVLAKSYVPDELTISLPASPLKQLLDTKPKALLIDLDGTLTDTEADFLEAMKNGLKLLNLTLTDGTAERIVGGNAVYYKETLEEQLGAANADKMYALITKLRLEKWDSQGVKLIDGAEELLKNAKRDGIKLALVTSTARDLTFAKLAYARVLSLFDVIVTAECYEGFKPSPAPYLKTLELLQIPAADCLAFEDSAPGLLSATAAGLRTVLIAGVVDVDETVAEKAEVIIKNFEL